MYLDAFFDRTVQHREQHRQRFHPTRSGAFGQEALFYPQVTLDTARYVKGKTGGVLRECRLLRRLIVQFAKAGC